jgi:hypothetical protein
MIMAHIRPVTISLRLGRRPAIRSCFVAQRQITRRFLSTEEVTDAHIAELAAKPLHPLTLGDLVKYVYYQLNTFKS